ncbi:MAG: hypothetical protein ACTHM7_08365, partial [Ginsengibacter sp.]
YMGVFNFFIVIPQLVASFVIGFLIRDVFHDQAIYALVIGGICMAVGGIMNFIVVDKDETVKKIIPMETVT